MSNLQKSDLGVEKEILIVFNEKWKPLPFDDIKIANRQNANICLILFFNLQYSHSIFHFSPYTLTLSIHPSFREIKNSNSYLEKLLNG